MTIAEPALTTTAVPPAPMERREALAIALFATWCVTGLFLDGWSHGVAKPESFFTPWHGLLYSGFGASVGWAMYEGNRARLRGVPDPWSATDRLTTLGGALFVAGMVGDFAWHAVFGIEVDIEALLSPTHLLLMTGGLLLASIPLRARLASAGAGGSDLPAPTFRDLFPVLVSTAMTVGVVLFFLQFASAFAGRSVAEFAAAEGMEGAQPAVVWGVLSILVTNAVLVAATAVLSRSWRTPFGTHAFVVGTVALLCSGLDGFEHGGLVLAAVLGGLAADVAVARGRADLAPVVLPVVLWPAWFAVLALGDDLRWSAEMVGGPIFLAALTGIAVRFLAAAPAPAPAPAPTPETPQRAAAVER